VKSCSTRIHMSTSDKAGWRYNNRRRGMRSQVKLPEASIMAGILCSSS
jgi:hypothetical protein